MNHEDDCKALVAYVLLARDPMEFAENLETMSQEALRTLYKMLTFDSPRHSARTKELNIIGADIVKGMLL